MTSEDYRSFVPRTRLALFVAGLVLLVVTPNAVGALPNPCTLLTASEVAQVVGGTVTGRTLSGNVLVRSCTWKGPTYRGAGGPTQAGLTLTIFRESKSKFEYYSTRISKKQSREAVRVNAIGDEAFFYPGGNSLLRVRKGGNVLTLHGVLVVPSEKQLAILGKSAVRRL
jgi:hypothetical protein